MPVLPGVWLNEGGQSATGALLDHVIRWHGAGGEPTPERHRAICQRVMELRAADVRVSRSLRDDSPS